MIKKITWGLVAFFLGLVLATTVPAIAQSLFNMTNGLQAQRVTIFGSSGTEVTSFGGDGAITDGDASNEADVLTTDPDADDPGLVVRVAGLGSDCDQTASVIINTTANNEIIPLAAGEDIIICNIVLVAEGTVAVQAIYGTGTACATDETNLSGPISLKVDGTQPPGFSAGNSGGTLFVPTGKAFCLELSGNVAVNGWVSYIQYDATP